MGNNLLQAANQIINDPVFPIERRIMRTVTGAVGIASAYAALLFFKHAICGFEDVNPVGLWGASIGFAACSGYFFGKMRRY